MYCKNFGVDGIPKTHPKTPKKGGLGGDFRAPQEKFWTNSGQARGFGGVLGRGVQTKKSGQILEKYRIFYPEKNSGRTPGGGAQQKSSIKFCSFTEFLQ